MIAIDEKIVKIKCRDGYETACRVFSPADPVSDIICLHGIQSHSGWYIRSSRKLAQAGFRVIFPDRRGSGLNTQNRGDTPSWQDLINDIEATAGYFQCGVNTTLMAISWGAKLAVKICLGDYPWLNKIIFVTPGIISKLGFGISGKLKIAANQVFNGGKGFFTIPIPGADYFTRDQRWRRYINDDPYTLRKCTARFFFNSNKIDKLALVPPKETALAALLLLARDDRIIDNHQTKQYFEKYFTCGRNLTKTYPGCEHTLEFDMKDLGFADDIIRWLMPVRV